MGHTISDRRRRERERELNREEIAARERAQAEDIEHARAVVAAWIKRTQQSRKHDFYPTIAACIIAELPVLEVLCFGCRTVGTVDLRKLDRHPGTALSSLIPSLSCRICCPNPPFAKLGPEFVGATAGRARVKCSCFRGNGCVCMCVSPGQFAPIANAALVSLTANGLEER